MIWNNEKKEVEDENFFDLPNNIENNLQLASKLMDILKKVPCTAGYKTKVLKTSILLQALQEETKQKDTIIHAIVDLRKANCLSEEEFKLMLLSYNSCAKF